MMTMKQNPLTGDWMCSVEGVPSQTYFIPNKGAAKRFIAKVNKAFECGELQIINGRVVKA
jgi:hypothetical protein